MRNALLIALALSLAASSHAQVKLLRHPTYSKGKVAFSYLGDLWIANENGSGAQRLTDNKARDVFPRFSPTAPRSPSPPIAKATTTCLRDPGHRRQTAPAHLSIARTIRS